MAMSGSLTRDFALHPVPSDPPAAELALPDPIATDPIAADRDAPEVIAPSRVAPDLLTLDLLTPDLVAPDLVAPDLVTHGVLGADRVAPELMVRLALVLDAGADRCGPGGDEAGAGELRPGADADPSHR
jgi:hypothetical protein